MHTEGGIDMIRHFLVDIAGCKADWTMDQVLEEQLKKIADVVRGLMSVGCGWGGWGGEVVGAARQTGRWIKCWRSS